MEPLISVIIPVYKVEEYLDRCVSSVVNQTYKNLEIILVDDGSPDKCPKMCDKWAEKDSRIKVIHKENGGAGQARNVGISASKGNIIAFLDSDDFLSCEMYECLISYINDEVDIVECGYVETYMDDVTFDDADNPQFKTYDNITAMSEHIKDRMFRQVIWNKLYKRDIIEDVYFPVGKLIDDEFWTYRAISNAKKLARTNLKLYAYRQQNESVMHQSFSLKRLQGIDAKIDRLDYLSKHYPVLVSKAKIDLWKSCLYQGQMCMMHLDKDEKNRGIEFLKKTLNRCKLNKNDVAFLSPKYKIWAVSSSVNFTLTCRIRNILKIGV